MKIRGFVIICLLRRGRSVLWDSLDWQIGDRLYAQAVRSGSVEKIEGSRTQSNGWKRRKRFGERGLISGRPKVLGEGNAKIEKRHSTLCVKVKPHCARCHQEIAERLVRCLAGTLAACLLHLQTAVHCILALLLPELCLSICDF